MTVYSKEVLAHYAADFAKLAPAAVRARIIGGKQQGREGTVGPVFCTVRGEAKRTFTPDGDYGNVLPFSVYDSNVEILDEAVQA